MLSTAVLGFILLHWFRTLFFPVPNTNETVDNENQKLTWKSEELRFQVCQHWSKILPETMSLQCINQINKIYVKTKYIPTLFYAYNALGIKQWKTEITNNILVAFICHNLLKWDNWCIILWGPTNIPKYLSIS